MKNIYPKWAEALVQLESLEALTATATMFGFLKGQGVDIEDEGFCRPIIVKWLNDAIHRSGAREALQLLNAC